MGISVSLILVAVGAILTWAVTTEVSGIDITTVGVKIDKKTVEVDRRAVNLILWDVAGEAARGIAEIGRTTGIPVVFEVLATESIADAEARAGGAHGNKGWEAAESALEMADLLDRLPGGTRREQEEGSKR